MEYKFTDIEKKWQAIWKERHTYRTENHSEKPKYYVLDMFPYPSGAGLHVGHPLGYIASDIVARYKRLAGFNVLHPMGFDSFGLPAEQYAIQTGQHPEKTTKENIARYIDQMNMIGFSFDWEREVRTSDPSYYKWTQWIFLQIFKSWYNCKTNKAEPIDSLISVFEREGFSTSLEQTKNIEESLKPFSAEQWKDFSEKEKSDVLMHFRLAYLDEAWVNWCPQLGTVLANDEVKDGVSERGGFPVERKRMPQWSMRITSYADRLLHDLDKLDWTESMKEAQRNWIGRSQGTSLIFKIQNSISDVEVFTTRPDTIFGVTFVTLAPEHELVSQITTEEYKSAVDTYVTAAKNRSERERMADVKKITGQFTGAYVIHPFTNEKIPVWIGDYVLAGYGTGAVMAVPAHDSRDYAFAKHFELPIKEVVSGGDISKESYDAKEGKCVNSGFLNGLDVKDAVKKAIEEIEKLGIGKGKVNYRLRDAAFGRQRYWGEPIPIYYKDGIPMPLDESELPLVLPEIEKFLPTETGEPPLARATDWKYKSKYDYEYTTMPGWAGSSWYFLRYMDPKNEKEFVSKDAVNYWKNVDLYLGGAEHATGHLLYVRFWTKFLFDRDLIPMDEPAQKLINQGMIQGRSNFVYRVYVVLHDTPQEDGVVFPEVYISYNYYQTLLSYEKAIGVGNINDDIKSKYIFLQGFIIQKEIEYNALISNLYPNYRGKCTLSIDGITPLRVDVKYVENDILDLDKFREWKHDYNAQFICEDGQYICGSEIEKMSKSKWNVVSPDDICIQYGADTLRLYEMFLGPLEQHKPWNTNGITGVYSFLKRFWRLFFDENGNMRVSNDAASEAELKVVNRTLKKIKDDIDRYSFNTCVSQFMICVNELMELKSNKREVLEPLVIALSPFAPHISEELWEVLGNKESVTKASFPAINEKYLTDTDFAYPVQINGKVRFNFTASVQLSPAEVEKEILSSDEAKKWLEGKTPKKVIVVPKRIVNIVV
ncbi:MAG: class I tRNA ligase family protein [Bacteroidia bacterium]